MHRSQRVFYTRTGWPVWSIPVGTVVLLGIGHSYDVLWRALILTGMVEVFAIGLVLETAYAIESDSRLDISGPLARKQVIAVDSIRRIEAVRSFSPAPAFSSDRLAIHFSTDEVVMISPERPADFVEILMALNPNIAVTI